MDSHPLDGLDAAVQALREVWPDGGLQGVAPGELRSANDALGVARRHLDGAFAAVAAEISRQSRPEFGKDGFARKQGFASPTALISVTAGTTGGDAAKLIRVGEGTAPRQNLVGEELPAKHPHVADAVRSGSIGVAASAAIIAKLDSIAPRVAAGALEEAERLLAEQAPQMGFTQLTALIARVEAHLDPDGVAPREDELRTARSLRIREDANGMLHLVADLDPEGGAFVKAAISALVDAEWRRGKGTASRHNGSDATADDGASDADAAAEDEESASAADDGVSASAAGDGYSETPPVIDDERSMPQRRADALVDLCRHALGCTEVSLGRATTTVVVRMDLEDLRRGVGFGTIDGVAQPVSVGTVRRMAAAANIIPCVLGGESEILDWGRAKRLFTPAQKLAIGERDGGCAGCGLPPEFCEVHHVRWWDRDAGSTDLRNGIQLCSRCHHRIHDDGWEIRIDGPGTTARVWLIPPSWLDPDRTPQQAWSLKYLLAA